MAVCLSCSCYILEGHCRGLDDSWTEGSAPSNSRCLVCEWAEASISSPKSRHLYWGGGKIWGRYHILDPSRVAPAGPSVQARTVPPSRGFDRSRQIRQLQYCLWGHFLIPSLTSGGQMALLPGLPSLLEVRLLHVQWSLHASDPINPARAWPLLLQGHDVLAEAFSTGLSCQQRVSSIHGQEQRHIHWSAGLPVSESASTCLGDLQQLRLAQGKKVQCMCAHLMFPQHTTLPGLAWQLPGRRHRAHKRACLTPLAFLSRSVSLNNTFNFDNSPMCIFCLGFLLVMVVGWIVSPRNIWSHKPECLKMWLSLERGMLQI